MKGRKRFVVGLAVVAGALGYLLYTAMGSSVSYYLSVGEAVARAATLGDRGVRVSGVVQANSIHWDPATLRLEFSLAEGGAQLPVRYQGVRPDLFEGGRQVVVEGRFTPEGVFSANTLLVKCPSKYESAVPEPGR